VVLNQVLGVRAPQLPDANSVRNNLLCFVTGVAAQGTSYKHVGILKYIDPAGRIVDSAQLYHIIYLQLVGLTSINVRSPLSSPSSVSGR
jgi:hypothetical protein